MITGNEFKERITKLVDRIGIGLGVVNPGLFERSLVDDPTRFGKLTLLAKRRIERSVDNEMALDPNAPFTSSMASWQSCGFRSFNSSTGAAAGATRHWYARSSRCSSLRLR